MTDKPFEGEIMPLSEAAEGRHALMLNSATRLAELGQRAINRGMEPKEFIVVCVAVDSRWRNFADFLMPNQDWQALRDLGAEPMARGTVTKPICKYLSEKLPEIKDALMEDPAEGNIKVIVLDDTGGTVYEMKPKQEGRLQ